jgi:protein-S-isoprenylcysteine O-methyltransferase Ste14
MRKVLSLAFAAFCYLVFLVSFAGLALFTVGLGGGLVPKLDGAVGRAAPMSIAVDLGLVLLFGVQHSVMARPVFKRTLARFVPDHLERSMFVLASALCLMAVVAFWAPVGGTLWKIESASAAMALQGVALLGYALTVFASFAFNHFELFGLSQAWNFSRGREAAAPEFRLPPLYRLVRHPMMLGILIGVWTTPTMTASHLILAAAMTLYIRVGVHFEERDLVRHFGDRYLRYRAEVPALLPWPRPAPSVSSESVADV